MTGLLNPLIAVSAMLLSSLTVIGNTLLLTKMTCRQVEVRPQASVAVHVLLMVNSSGHGPATVMSVKVKVGTPPQLSDPVGLPVEPGNVLVPNVMVIFGGQVMTGGVLSNTVMVWAQVAELPQASVAL
jgi:hypothetical protein